MTVVHGVDGGEWQLGGIEPGPGIAGCDSRWRSADRPCRLPSRRRRRRCRQPPERLYAGPRCAVPGTPDYGDSAFNLLPSGFGPRLPGTNCRRRRVRPRRQVLCCPQFAGRHATPECRAKSSSSPQAALTVSAWMAGGGQRGFAMTSTAPTAAVLLIGDEILSGRTKDKNSGFLADYLSALGIDLKEARVVSDQEDDIVAALNALRARYTYVSPPAASAPPMTTSRRMRWPRPSAWRSTTTLGRSRSCSPISRRSGVSPTRRGSALRGFRRAPALSTIRCRRRRASRWAMSSSWRACRRS